MNGFEALNGKARGEEYARRMDAYLARVAELPMLNGSINVKAIAEAAGIPTQSVYKNPTIREALESAKTRFGVQSWAENKASSHAHDKPETVPRGESDGKILRLEKRLSELEQRYSAAMAENYDLRQQLKDLRLQLAREDMMIESGRRIAAPTDE
ncbi:Prp19/Pso4 [Burkholderia sp. Ch1-1]|nr:Prp19/Pso4 [Burkholderia sp. Ch1-1]